MTTVEGTLPVDRQYTVHPCSTKRRQDITPPLFPHTPSPTQSPNVPAEPERTSECPPTACRSDRSRCPSQLGCLLGTPTLTGLSLDIYLHHAVTLFDRSSHSVGERKAVVSFTCVTTLVGNSGLKFQAISSLFQVRRDLMANCHLSAPKFDRWRHVTSYRPLSREHLRVFFAFAISSAKQPRS